MICKYGRIFSFHPNQYFNITQNGMYLKLKESNKGRTICFGNVLKGTMQYKFRFKWVSGSNWSLALCEKNYN